MISSPESTNAAATAVRYCLGDMGPSYDAPPPPPRGTAKAGGGPFSPRESGGPMAVRGFQGVAGVRSRAERQPVSAERSRGAPPEPDDDHRKEFRLRKNR
ncbi:hypothetical protein GCM10010428_37070 [Actinosynnema pretiosum subsp. pretiosum]